MQRLLSLVLLFFIGTFSVNGTLKDTTDVISHSNKDVWDERGEVVVRSFQQDKINAYKKNPRYRYDRGQGPGFWENLLLALLSWIFITPEGRPWFFYILLGLVGLGGIFMVLKFLDVPMSKLLVLSLPHDAVALQFGTDEQEISLEKLNEMLQLYRNNGAYREAVRVLFHLYLRVLQEKGAIKLRNYKTNVDYFHEIGDESEKMRFQRLSHMFEAIWYGHLSVSEAQYKKMEMEFKEACEGGKL